MKKHKAYLIIVVGVKGPLYEAESVFYDGKKEVHEKIRFPFDEKNEFVKSVKTFCDVHNISFVDDVMITGRLWKNRGVSRVA